MQKNNLIDQSVITMDDSLRGNSISIDSNIAFALGDLDLAAILQQIHYWLRVNKKKIEDGTAKVDTYKDGRYWYFSTYEQFGKQLLWMSVVTIKRKIAKLVEMGILIKGNYNKWKADRTLWYTIDYEKLAELGEEFKKRLSAKNKDTERRKEKQKEYRKKQNSTKKQVYQNDTTPDHQNDITNNNRLPIQKTTIIKNLSTMIPNLIRKNKKERETTPINIDLAKVKKIEDQTGLKLSIKQQIEVSKWDDERLDKAISLFIKYGGYTFSYLCMCYNNPITKSSNNMKLSDKVKQFNDLGENNTEWDFNELERLQDEHIRQLTGIREG